MNVYGARQDSKGSYLSVIVRMLNALDGGLSPTIQGDGFQAYDFIDVIDCARANVLAMQTSASRGAYNVGTGIKTSIRLLAQKIAAAHPNGLEAHFVPSERAFVQCRVGAIASSERDLQFKANIDLETGLKNLIQWRADKTRVDS
jgi:UDP-glucose 4-epimerase